MNEQPGKFKEDDHDIIYALRTVHQNQTQLNIMADQKANIIVGTIVIFLTFLGSPSIYFNPDFKR